ncbi:unnamed protein product [Dibothriocephalus latus]|uniref:Uncharacterized protein n=1 Tax=Dibothriocephalus latus TaxID=60516 RepID=A0A3P7RFP0_DIBLA|nr:unnamed protein product [Dibothriocephalus latus]
MLSCALRKSTVRASPPTGCWIGHGGLQSYTVRLPMPHKTWSQHRLLMGFPLPKTLLGRGFKAKLHALIASYPQARSMDATPI